jgi:hypothetical protein
LPPRAVDPSYPLDGDLKNKIDEAWNIFRLGWDAIIGVFDKDKKAFLFQIGDEEQRAINVTFPGFTAIGSGAWNAYFGYLVGNIPWG